MIERDGPVGASGGVAGARVEALFELSLALATTDSAEQIAARVLDTILAELDCSDAWAVEIDPDADRFLALDGVGRGIRVLAILRTRTAPPSWALLRAAASPAVAWLENAEHIRRRLAAVADEFPGVGSLVLVPLRPAGEVAPVGVVGLSFDCERPAAADDVAFLDAVGELAGQALHRAQLRRLEAAARRTVAAAADRAERVGALAAALVSAQTVEEVGEVLALHVQRAVNGQTFSLREVDRAANLARRIRVAGTPPDYRDRFTDVRLDIPSAMAEVATTNKAVFVSSAEENRRRFGREGSEQLDAARIEALVRLPLLVEGELLAILSIGYWEQTEFSDAERLFLTTVADLAAQALGRAMRSERLRVEARRHRLLSGAQAAINRRLDPADQLQALARVVVPELADFSSVAVLARPARPGVAPPVPLLTDRVACETVAGVEPAPLVRGTGWLPGDPMWDTVARGGPPTRLWRTPDVPEWAVRAGADAPFRTGLNHLVLAPVLVDGMVAAVVTFGMCNNRTVWTEEDLEIIAELAEYAAVALEHGLSYQHTRETALVLQHSLLSSPPQIRGLEFAARYRPAGRDEVGGDWYDAFELDPDHVAIAVGDVLGHDITAAAAMGQLRAVLRTLAMDRGLDPARVLERLAEANRLLSITSFATAMFGRLLRLEEGWGLSWSSAGHLPPLLVEPGRPARTLTEADGGAALVQGGTPACRLGRIRLEPGSTLVLYTDGLVERRGPDLDATIAELGARVAALAAEPVEAVCDALLHDAPDRDDVALLVVRTVDHGGRRRPGR
ncbi:MAG: GAF domain-containing SpoIIE family protein phosphatase [Sporichthyaceae bacterium]